MKNTTLIIFVALVLVVLSSALFLFQVRETELALVVRLGKPIDEIIKPGWHFRWLAPIDRVYKFDSRMRVFEADLGETTTKGAIPIVVNTYVAWKVAEPRKFFTSVKTVKEAETKLLSQLSDTQNNIIGKYNFSDFINTDPTKIKFDQIQQEMLEDLRAELKGNYGIKIETLGIKQLQVSEEVSKDVFVRMSAERNRRTDTTISQGEAEATRIRADADSKKAILLAAAQGRAKAIRGQGDAEAAKYYKMLKDDPDLAMFLRDIEALKKIMQKNTTVVLSADSEPFKILKAMPNIKPKP
ncbi:MAG: protease modulator HflC [Planctomycetota bacterium]|jgi:membrane protease subunit HflC